MNNKTNIEEDINRCKKIIEDNTRTIQVIEKTLTSRTEKEELEKDNRAIENILADRERLEKEKKIHIKQEQQYKKEYLELRNRPIFYYDNNRNTYVWCCRCTDSNMSLHMFLENGEIFGYASEHYDKWVENAKEIKQIDVCEFMHKFVKPLIIKANKYDSLVEKIRYRIKSVKNCYDDLIKPYYDEELNIINTSYMNKKEKEEFINKRNCLLVQKATFEEVLQELLDFEKGEQNAQI